MLKTTKQLIVLTIFKCQFSYFLHPLIIYYKAQNVCLGLR